MRFPKSAMVSVTRIMSEKLFAQNEPFTDRMLMVLRLIFGIVDNCPMLTAMNIDRHSRKMDGDSLNNFTIEHYLNNNNSSTRDIMNNVINVRADGTHEFDAHSSPVIAPNEPNHNSKYPQNERNLFFSPNCVPKCLHSGRARAHLHTCKM